MTRPPAKGWHAVRGGDAWELDLPGAKCSVEECTDGHRYSVVGENTDVRALTVLSRAEAMVECEDVAARLTAPPVEAAGERR